MSTSPRAEAQAPPAECTMHTPCTSACSGPDTRSVLLLCRAATSPTVLSEGLFAGLKDGVAQQQLIVCQMTRQRRRQATRTWFRGRRRRRSPLACERQGRCQKTPTWTLLADLLTASPAWGFFFFGNNVLWTSIWSLSIDISFNLQDGRTLLTCPFLAIWTAFVCACNSGRTRQALKRRPWAAKVMAKSRHVLRVLEVRCLPLRHFRC